MGKKDNGIGGEKEKEGSMKQDGKEEDTGNRTGTNGKRMRMDKEGTRGTTTGEGQATQTRRNVETAADAGR